MGTLKTKGIIIAENNMGDFDKMVTMLTPNGKIGCSAKGARRAKSQLMAGTQFLCFGEYMLFKGTNTYTLNSCETIELFYNIRMDLDKLESAVHITKIIQDVTDENQNTYKILQLYLNTLYIIGQTQENFTFIEAIFKIRLLSLLGFRPRIEQCCTCKETEKLHYFSFKDSGLKCENCAKQDTGAIQISESTKQALRYIILAPAKKLFSFQIAEENQRQLALIAKIYTNDKLEKEYEA
ncbi:MAG: DNA repair protein RecO [Clostridia bacterium]